MNTANSNFMNKIPDDTIFGPNDSGEGINYRYVRSIQDETELIRLLKLRLEGFFVRQVQPLQDAHSAFPLAVMTCVGIETLGEIFVPEKDGDTSYQLGMFRKVFSTPALFTLSTLVPIDETLRNHRQRPQAPAPGQPNRIPKNGKAHLSKVWRPRQAGQVLTNKTVQNYAPKRTFSPATLR